ncbi:MAG: trypsin-like peptidase domain-containing protein, partial [Planctomycetota bacterium]
MRWFFKGAALGLLTSVALGVVDVSLAAAGDRDATEISATSYRRATVGSSPQSRETPTVKAIRRASPSVVNLHGQKMVRGSTSTHLSGPKQVNGMGTGVILDSRGYVVTNYHVVQDVGQINATLFDGQATQADLIASDPSSDLALVKLRTNRPLPTVPRGRSDDLMIGETVIAIGNAFGYVHTSTQGIISALHRDIPVNETQEYRDLIQTSAGINPGNSGGPLLNIDGEMIGVNVAVRVGAQQIAFAIPIDQVLETVTEMVRRDNDRRSLIGMQGRTDASGGFRVTGLVNGGSAQMGGLQKGDVITMLGETPIDDELECALTILEMQPESPIRVEFERDGDLYETEFSGTRMASARNAKSDSAWRIVGVTIRPTNSSTTRQLNQRLGTNYRGGLTVTAVRPGSAADQAEIEVGDVLLGIHSWQTANAADLAGILEHPEIRSGGKAKFYLVRR